jgi:hypothetical protein
MSFFLLRLWPLWLPLLCYLAWWRWRVLRAQKLGIPIPALKDGPWFSTTLVAIGLLALSLLWLGVSAERSTGGVVKPITLPTKRL